MLRWLISLGKKFLRIVPMYTLAASFATLISQLSVLLAFFFPLKVLILLGSPELPDYFPRAWQAIEHNYFIWGFTLAAIGFYLLHLLSEKMIVLYTQRGAKILLEKSKKIILFNNQNEIAAKVYEKFSRALASIVFLLSGLLIIGILCPSLLGLLIGLGLLGFLILMLRRQKNLVTFITFINFFSTLTFFLGFTFIVFLSLSSKGPGVIEAIICLLLMRQLTTRFIGLSKDLSHLLLQRPKINALFFHDKHLNIQLSEHEKSWQAFIEKPSRDDWIKKILHSVVSISPEHIESYWRPIGIAEVLAFEVVALDKNNVTLGHYFIKFFKQQIMALHEASLFMDPNAKTLPAFLFLGAVELNQYRCHVFSMKAIEKAAPNKPKPKQQEVLEKLIAYTPSDKLLKTYRRSKPMLGHRLNQDMITRLKYLTHDPDQIKNLNTLEKNLNLLCEKLNALPVQIINPDTLNTAFYTQTDEVKITHWGIWSFEPLGASWPIKQLGTQYFNDLLKQAQKIHPLSHSNDIKLAALLYAFEEIYKKGLYNEALELLPSILASDNGHKEHFYDYNNGNESAGI